MSLELWALWGLLGAFVYAAPRLLVALGEARSTGKPVLPQIGEFFVALTFGPIFAAGFGPFAAGWLNRESEQEVRAIALVIGMVANPLAPSIVKLATGDVLSRIGGVFKGGSGQ